MPLAKIHVLQGHYDDARIAKVSGAIQAALMNTLRVPADDFYQLIFELPKNRFLHTPSFVGMHYTDDLIILDVSFIQGRTKETRLALLKEGLRGVEWAIFVWIMPESCAFPRFFALRARLEIAMILDGKN